MPKKNLTKKACYIVWIDSEYEEGDADQESKRLIRSIHTMGWLLKDGPDDKGHHIYTVCKELDTDGWCRRTTDIPKEAVKHIAVWDEPLVDDKGKRIKI